MGFPGCARSRCAQLLNPQTTQDHVDGGDVQGCTNDLPVMKNPNSIGPLRIPTMASEWPFRSLMALYTTRPDPSSSGIWLTGVAKVLSTIWRHHYIPRNDQLIRGFLNDINGVRQASNNPIDSLPASPSWLSAQPHRPVL